MSIFQPIKIVCKELEEAFPLISKERKNTLDQLKAYISQQFAANKTPQLVVICTHNSRRSHIGQLWLAVGADYYGLPPMLTFSGGTEATAFNSRAVAAFQRLGFDVSTKDKQADNPVYQIKWQEAMLPYQAFSKKYTDQPNPKENFAAIMVCSEADEECPVVLGCDFRLSLPYDDPKSFDDTALEEAKYDERALQIGREIFYVLSQFNKI